MSCCLLQRCIIKTMDDVIIVNTINVLLNKVSNISGIRDLEREFYKTKKSFHEIIVKAFKKPFIQVILYTIYLTFRRGSPRSRNIFSTLCSSRSIATVSYIFRLTNIRYGKFVNEHTALLFGWIFKIRSITVHNI